MTLLFYISGHGFGHASRDVEIIHALAGLIPDLRLIIRSSVNPALLNRTLSIPYELRPGPCDTGIIQKSSIEQDDEATVREAVKFYREYDARIAAEVAAVALDAPDVIVGDIAPLAFDVARRIGVPGIAVGNFTWDWIYETHPGLMDAAPWIVPRVRAAYRQATLALQLPFAGGFEVFPVVRAVPLVARHPTRSRADTRRHFGLPGDGRVVLLSFGGYGLPGIDLAGVDCLDGWTVVTTDRLAVPVESLPPSVRMIPEQAFAGSAFRYEDLVAAVDVVLTKPGFGITAECVTTGAAMLYTSRGEFREYDLLVREIPRYIRSLFIDQTELLAGRWRDALDALMAQPPPPETMATDGAQHVAQAVATATGLTLG